MGPYELEGTSFGKSVAFFFFECLFREGGCQGCKVLVDCSNQLSFRLHIEASDDSSEQGGCLRWLERGPCDA
jgi:hypothetical protein